MTLSLQKLANLLDANDTKTNDFKNRVINSLNDANAMNRALNQHCYNQKQTNCYSCDDEGVCLALSGIAYLDLNNIETAIQYIENANIHFRRMDEAWNTIIGLELLGIAYEMNGRRHHALMEYQQALQLIKIYHRTHSQNYENLDKIQMCENELKEHLEHAMPASTGAPTAETPPFVPDPVPENVPDPAPKNAADRDPEGFISIPWIPIYENVQAGANGLIWIEPPNHEKTELHQVFLQGSLCSIHPVHKDNHCVTINSKKQYAWARVCGHSMEEAIPTPIQENDYVLFYMADAAEVDGIVVVAQQVSGPGDSIMVKRIDLERQMLLSQTGCSGGEYEPIPFDPERHQIVGIVVAVAKPQNGKTPASA